MIDHTGRARCRSHLIIDGLPSHPCQIWLNRTLLPKAIEIAVGINRRVQGAEWIAADALQLTLIDGWAAI